MSVSGHEQLADMRRPSSEEFRAVIGRFASGVTVITANDGEPKGTTASAFTSLSLDPPMVLICLHRESATGEAVDQARRFAVNILAEGQASEAMNFAGKQPDKFTGIDFTLGPGGEPLLAGALATLECRVAEVATGGTHLVFFGEVERATAHDGSPLAYFQGRFGRLELAQDEDAVSEIRTLVLSRGLTAGEPLSLDELATRVDCPRGSAYHALTRLIGEGLVTRSADGAFVVRPLTADGVAETWRARCAIELGVAALTVGSCDESTIDQLRELSEAARPAEESDFELSEWLPKYNAFHERFVELCGSTALLEAYRRINAPAAILSVTQQTMEHQGLARDQCETAHLHTQALVSAYEQRDLAAAHAAIKLHEQFASDVASRFMQTQDSPI